MNTIYIVLAIIALIAVGFIALLVIISIQFSAYEHILIDLFSGKINNK